MTRDSKVLFYLESDTRAMLDAELASRREAGWSGSLSALIEELVRDRLAEFGWRVVGGEAQQVPGELVDPREIAFADFMRQVRQAGERLMEHSARWAVEDRDDVLDGSGAASSAPGGSKEDGK